MLLYIILLLTILTLFGIAIFDIETATIPHTLTIIFLILGIIYCCIDDNFMPQLTITSFVAMFILQVALFFIFGEDAIGGGDVKILSISTLFWHTFNDVYDYCLLLCFFTIFSYIIAKLKKEKHIKYGPYMSLALCGTLLISINCSIREIIWFSLIFVVCLLLIDTVFFKNRRLIDNVQKDFFIIKK